MEVSFQLGDLEQLHVLNNSQDMDADGQPIVQAVWYLLNYAFENRVSDIHIEPKREESWVRRELMVFFIVFTECPKSFMDLLYQESRPWLALDIAERRRPQDGRFKPNIWIKK